MANENIRSAHWNAVFVCWMVACVATLGSLFFSEVMHRVPCVLCWYQRIFMFPLLFVFTVGLFPFDVRCVRYALPIALAGWAVALYHWLLYVGIVPESMQPCTQGISCADAQMDLVGFLSIPLLSLAAFSLIVALTLAVRRSSRK